MVFVCGHVFYQWLKSTCRKVQALISREFNSCVTTSPPVSSHSLCQPVENPTSVTLPMQTCLGRDASVVCSASIDSPSVYYQSGRATTMLIHSPASAIPLHTRVKSTSSLDQNFSPKTK